MRSFITIAVAIVALFLVALNLGDSRDAHADYMVAGCAGSASVGCSGETLVRWTPLRNMRARRAARINARQSSGYGCSGAAPQQGCGGAEAQPVEMHIHAPASCSGSFDPLPRATPVRTVIRAPLRVLGCANGQCLF